MRRVDSLEKTLMLGGIGGWRGRGRQRMRWLDGVYVEQQAFNEFLLDMELQPVSSGGNVVITIPHDETPCMFYREINDSLVTSPVQTVIDLLGNAGRGEEAAEAIIAKEFKE